jgi:hypothetical protein
VLEYSDNQRRMVKSLNFTHLNLEILIAIRNFEFS